MTGRTRVTHTPCGMAVDLDSSTNRLMTPDTDVEHTCPVTTGPHHAVRHGRRWTVENVLDPHHKQPIYPTQTDAQNEASRLNNAPARRRTPDLFNSQEATS